MWNQYTTLKSKFFSREIEKNYLLKVRNRRLWWRLGWRMRRWMHATSAADGWRNSALVLKNKTKLLLSLLCEINSQLFVYNFKTIKIIIYVSLERSDPYDLCCYCTCQMRLLENPYRKNVNLQKNSFFFVKLKNCHNLGELFLWNGKHKFEMILEKNIPVVI